jgi:hypothetical protein
MVCDVAIRKGDVSKSATSRHIAAQMFGIIAPYMTQSLIEEYVPTMFYVAMIAFICALH